MEKKELQAKLDEVVKQIKTNSKDAHFADALIDKALSLKGQMGVEPLELDLGKKEKSYKGKTFEIVKTNNGILYRGFGGYNVFVKLGTNTALYETLEEMMNFDDVMKELNEKEKEDYELGLSAIMYCLTIPTFVFTDKDLTFKLATEVVSFLQNLYDDATKETKEETPKENKEFEDTTKALEVLKNAPEK